MTSLEVCIVSYDSGEDLARAVLSVRRHLPGAEIAIREHASHTSPPTELIAQLDSFGMRVRYTRDSSNPGFGAGCNALAAGSDAEWLLFLNPDAEITHWPGLPRAAVVAGPQHLTGRRAASHRGTTLGVHDEIRRSWFRRHGPPPRGFGFVSGAALLVERSAHERIGGFDESYFMFYEDVDYCMRAGALGLSVELLPGWKVTHTGAHATSPLFDESIQWSYESGCRFHTSTGHSVRGFRVFVAFDSLMRAGLHFARRDSRRSRAYLHLLRRAVGDLVRLPSPGRAS